MTEYDGNVNLHEYMTATIRSNGTEIPRESWITTVETKRPKKSKKVLTDAEVAALRREIEEGHTRIPRILRWRNRFWADYEAYGISPPWASLDELLKWEDPEDYACLDREEIAQQFVDGFSDLVYSGKSVFKRSFDGGGPAHSGSGGVTKWDGGYWRYYTDEELDGPYDTVEDSLHGVLTMVGSGRTRIESCELTAEQIASHLWLGYGRDIDLVINDEPWRLVSEDGQSRFEPCPDGDDHDDDDE